MNVLDENVVSLTLLSLFIIAGKSEANIFEDANDETMFIFTLIFLAVAVVFLIIVIFILWCLCRRRWRLHHGERIEYKESRSSYDETRQQHQVDNQYQLERKENVVPKSFTNDAYEQYNDKRKGQGTKDNNDDDEDEDIAF